jgi:GNAT superfamily N-acetyltransferase
MIRPATLDELRARPDLIAEAGKATGIDPAVQWDVMETIYESGAMVLIGVEDRGELIGYVCAIYAAELWRDRTTLQTVSLYCRRAHRLRGLLETLRDVADARGASLRLQVIPGSRLERTARRMGYAVESVAMA